MTRLRVLVLALVVAIVEAQSDVCYYPNGDWAKDNQAPCSSGGGNCCSVGWDCLSNGLCHNPASNLTGRYGCTDRSWQSDSCTQICTNGNSAIGNEAILHCGGDVYCCNGDGSLNCCSKEGQSSIQFFQLDAGTTVTSITSALTVSPSLQPTTNRPASFTDGTPLSSTPSSTTSTPRTTTRSSTSSSRVVSSSTHVTSFTTTGSDGQAITTTQFSIVTVVTTATPGSSNNSSTTGRTIGLAVGLSVGLVALAALGLFLFFWRRRHQQQKNVDVRAHYAQDDAGAFAQKTDMTNSYGHFPPAGRAPEIDSFPVADTKNAQGELVGSIPGLGGVPPPPPTYSDRGSSYLGSQVDLNAVRGINEGAPAELDGDSVPLNKPELPGDSVPLTKPELPGDSPLRNEEKPGDDS